MWVFLNNAFLSIVQDKGDANMLMVRARLRGDLQRVFSFPDMKVLETPPPADYRFRCSVERWRVSDVLRVAVGDIDYTNFKKSVPDQRRHDAYLRVWSEMSREQEMQLVEENPDLVATVRSGKVVTKWDPHTGVILPPTTVRKRVSPRGKKGSRSPSSRRRK